MTGSPQCFPGDLEPLLAHVGAAREALVDAQAQLRAALPTRWAGSGAEAYARAVTDLLGRALGLDGTVDRVRHTALTAEAERAATRAARGGP